jgi:aspartate beta-hydroxylase
MNLQLRIHLPLILPTTTIQLSMGRNNDDNDSDEDDIPCDIRVGPIVRPWIQDKALVFDNAYNHEVWNRTNKKRVLLLVDIWHPNIVLV